MIKIAGLNICGLYLCLTIICTFSTYQLPAQQGNSKEEIAIREAVTRFYDGWNSHDIEKMISVYADSIDHINAFGEWHTGRQTMKDELTQFHARIGKKFRKKLILKK